MKTRIRQLTEQEKRSLGEQQMIGDWLQIFPKGILSIVADTFDLWKLITEYLPANKEQILNRDGKLVIRPDSGDPVDIICGKNSILNYNTDEFWELYSDRENFIFQDNNIVYKFDGDYLSDLFEEYGEETNDVTRTIQDLLKYNVIFKLEKQPSLAESKGVIELLWDIFGGTINEQGYKVLDPHIGAIYGDSITPERQVQIYERLAAKGFAATNIVLGIGSFTYQYNTRDTLGFAAKGAWFEVAEPCMEERCLFHTCNSKCKKSYNIYKDPVTDDGTKKSLKGLCAVSQDKNGEYVVQTECTPEEENQGLLQVIYEDGRFYNTTTLEEIRKRLSN